MLWAIEIKKLHWLINHILQFYKKEYDLEKCEQECLMLCLTQTNIAEQTFYYICEKLYRMFKLFTFTDDYLIIDRATIMNVSKATFQSKQYINVETNTCEWLEHFLTTGETSRG